ncbi:MAG: hypothetical protein V4629_01165 [Pseudomonadota bacterium]
MLKNSLNTRVHVSHTLPNSVESVKPEIFVSDSLSLILANIEKAKFVPGKCPIDFKNFLSPRPCDENSLHKFALEALEPFACGHQFHRQCVKSFLETSIRRSVRQRRPVPSNQSSPTQFSFFGLFIPSRSPAIPISPPEVSKTSLPVCPVCRNDDDNSILYTVLKDERNVKKANTLVDSEIKPCEIRLEEAEEIKAYEKVEEILSNMKANNIETFLESFDLTENEKIECQNNPVMHEDFSFHRYTDRMTKYYIEDFIFMFRASTKAKKPFSFFGLRKPDTSVKHLWDFNMRGALNTMLELNTYCPTKINNLNQRDELFKSFSESYKTLFGNCIRNMMLMLSDAEFDASDNLFSCQEAEKKLIQYIDQFKNEVNSLRMTFINEQKNLDLSLKGDFSLIEDLSKLNKDLLKLKLQEFENGLYITYAMRWVRQFYPIEKVDSRRKEIYMNYANRADVVTQKQLNLIYLEIMRKLNSVKKEFINESSTAPNSAASSWESPKKIEAYARGA